MVKERPGALGRHAPNAKTHQGPRRDSARARKPGPLCGLLQGLLQVLGPVTASPVGEAWTRTFSF